MVNREFYVVSAVGKRPKDSIFYKTIFAGVGIAPSEEDARYHASAACNYSPTISGIILHPDSDYPYTDQRSKMDCTEVQNDQELWAWAAGILASKGVAISFDNNTQLPPSQ